MNVSTLAIPKTVAAQKAEEYAELSGKQRNKEDAALEHLYKSIAKSGAKVINIADAFRETGLNEKGQPKLAIARADWLRVHLLRAGGFGVIGTRTLAVAVLATIQLGIIKLQPQTLFCRQKHFEIVCWTNRI